MRILVAEDDAFSRRFLTRTLQEWGYVVIPAADGDEAWDILQADDAPKLAMLDWMMPGMEGLEVCRQIRGRNEERRTYVVMLTAKGETADLVSAINAGADDFVVKSFDVRELEVRLRAATRILELEEAMWTQAMRDPLTGLWNHGAILNVLEKEACRARRQNLDVAVIVADIDLFKNVNDTYGHKGGDTTIVEVGDRLGAALRKYDTLGRYGGEEFVVVLPEADIAQAELVAERLRQSIAATPFCVEGRQVEVRMSFGTASMPGPKPEDVDRLIRAADAALYQAKADGRNCVRSAESICAAEQAPAH